MFGQMSFGGGSMSDAKAEALGSGVKMAPSLPQPNMPPPVNKTDPFAGLAGFWTLDKSSEHVLKNQHGTFGVISLSLGVVCSSDLLLNGYVARHATAFEVALFCHGCLQVDFCGAVLISHLCR